MGNILEWEAGDLVRVIRAAGVVFGKCLLIGDLEKQETFLSLDSKQREKRLEPSKCSVVRCLKVKKIR